MLMLEPQSDTDSGAYGAPLSWADSIKLHAATTLAICGALEAAGLISQKQMSETLARQVEPEDTALWACIVRALVVVLGAHPPESARPSSARAGPPKPFILIQGGLEN